MDKFIVYCISANEFVFVKESEYKEDYLSLTYTTNIANAKRMNENEAIEASCCMTFEGTAYDLAPECRYEG